MFVQVSADFLGKPGERDGFYFVISPGGWVGTESPHAQLDTPKSGKSSAFYPAITQNKLA
ncbi:hypothetical protein HMPREF0388_0284 [Mobiluncus curtisii ATCC 51333]|uniref:Uncharacterized protein n=1 Tax=Mobiluncus curtisii ATCC 51333 TaxID=887326 RepID=E6LX11_9ACTO|nr:hypothetical protein HMPREF0388_0284 [Mobiluncus curtisii ATCC 51333]